MHKTTRSKFRITAWIVFGDTELNQITRNKQKQYVYPNAIPFPYYQTRPISLSKTYNTRKKNSQKYKMNVVQLKTLILNSI